VCVILVSDIGCKINSRLDAAIQKLSHVRSEQDEKQVVHSLKQCDF